MPVTPTFVGEVHWPIVPGPRDRSGRAPAAGLAIADTGATSRPARSTPTHERTILDVIAHLLGSPFE